MQWEGSLAKFFIIAHARGELGPVSRALVRARRRHFVHVLDRVHRHLVRGSDRAHLEEVVVEAAAAAAAVVDRICPL